VLHSSLVRRLSLRWWLVRMAIAPFSQPPAFQTLLRLGSADVISFLRKGPGTGGRVQLHLAEGFSCIYWKDCHQKLIAAL